MTIVPLHDTVPNERNDPAFYEANFCNFSIEDAMSDFFAPNIKK